MSNQENFFNNFGADFIDFFKKPHLFERIKNHKDFKKFVLVGILSSGGLFALYKFYENFRNKRRENKENLERLSEIEKKKDNIIKVDTVFFKRLYRIIGIIIPKFASKEFQYFATLTILLLLRTYLTVEIAEILGIFK
jgi:hypothetical protein